MALFNTDFVEFDRVTKQVNLRFARHLISVAILKLLRCNVDDEEI